jgi:DNA-binding NarL/FixJ family response regulator
MKALRVLIVVTITMEGSESRFIEALSVGARGYIRQPFAPDQVKERITRLINGGR